MPTPSGEPSSDSTHSEPHPTLITTTNASRSKKIARLARTIKHLRATQIYHQILLKGRRYCHRLQKDRFSFSEWVSELTIPAVASRFLNKDRLLQGESFGADLLLLVLGQARDLDAVTRTWNHPHEPKLWRYNLHYFEFLNTRLLSVDEKHEIVSRWISSCRPGMEDAWEAYPTSLRLMNWIKAFIDHPSLASRSIKVSVAEQFEFLTRNEEKHLLANHYLKNLIALTWSSYITGHSSFRSYLKRMIDEVDHQFFEDGGHYERSPSYHCVILEMLLDTLNILGSSLASDAATTRLKTIVVRALQFLQDIEAPGGLYPLFGDSAFNVAPGVRELLEYGEALVQARILPTWKRDVTRVSHLSSSGIFRLSHKDSALFIKTSGVSPSYQPGHTHCDIGSFELFSHDRKIITDAGVYEYAPGLKRRLCRETRLHNALSVDQEEQHEVWGEFRIGRRARVNSAVEERTGQYVVTVTHDGFSHLAGSPIHQRSFTVPDDLAWCEIREELEGRGDHLVEVYLNLAPGLTLVLDGEVAHIQDEEGRELASVTIPKGTTAVVGESYYWPCFGVEYRTQRLTLRMATPLPTAFSYRLTFQ